MNLIYTLRPAVHAFADIAAAYRAQHLPEPESLQDAWEQFKRVEAYAQAELDLGAWLSCCPFHRTGGLPTLSCGGDAISFAKSCQCENANCDHENACNRTSSRTLATIHGPYAMCEVCAYRFPVEYLKP